MSLNVWIALACLYSLTTVAGAAVSERDGLPAKPALSTISALDIPRYMGTWYEIAKFPNRFQKKCTSSTSAVYRLKKDGLVAVKNRCRIDGGEIIEALGVARQTGTATSPRLKVRFAPEWLSFLPMVWGDYWVIDLDDRYTLVAVSEPERRYLWILARTSKVDPDAYRQLLTRLTKMGFDLDQLEITRQD